MMFQQKRPRDQKRKKYRATNKGQLLLLLRKEWIEIIEKRLSQTSY